MEPLRLFLTGEPGCGKTTVVTKLAERLVAEGVEVGGIVSAEIRESGARVGFSLQDLKSQERGILAHVSQSQGPRIGKYTVNLNDVETVAVNAINYAAKQANVIIVDEIGPMELKSWPFIHAVETALASPKHFIGTIHKRASHYLVSAIKSNPKFEVIEVTPSNRNELARTIALRLRAEQ